jgi:hypothetical protein
MRWKPSSASSSCLKREAYWLREQLTLLALGKVSLAPPRSRFARLPHGSVRPGSARPPPLPATRPRQEHDELAPLHSITSSARASSVGGTVMPRRQRGATQAAATVSNFDLHTESPRRAPAPAGQPQDAADVRFVNLLGGGDLRDGRVRVVLQLLPPAERPGDAFHGVADVPSRRPQDWELSNACGRRVVRMACRIANFRGRPS